MDYLPISLKLENQNCLIVGGGEIAYRKAKLLCSTHACLTIVSPEFCKNIIALKKDYNVKLCLRSFEQTDLDNIRLVIAATDDEKINSLIASSAEERGILVNVVDNKALCRFITSAIIDRSPLTIAISSSGNAPVYARMLREKLEWMLPEGIGELLTNIGKVRNEAAQIYPCMVERRKFWEMFFEERLNWSVMENVSAQETIETKINLKELSFNLSAPQERLNLIDIGNGDKDNLTVKMLKRFQKADKVFMSKSLSVWAQNLIRRDADIDYLEAFQKANSSNKPFTLLNESDLNYIMQKTKGYQDSLVVIAGNHFEEFEYYYLDFFKINVNKDIEIIRAPHN